MSNPLTTRQVAELFGIETWRVQRLFSDRSLPDTERFAGKRCIPATMLPAIGDALRDRGWILPQAQQAAVVGAGQ